jgi:hypothetical protein
MSAWTPDKVSVFRNSFYEFLNHIRVSSKEKGQMILGENLYLAQTMFYEAIFEGLADDCHDFYILKSRQLGITTGTRALSLFWIGMHEGLRGSMVFDSAFNTNAARQEIAETLDNLPAKLKFPRIKRRTRDALVLENDSWLLFMQAGTRNSRAGGGLGRSLGLNFCHASEVSSWVNEEGLTSFRQSLAQDWENRLYIWESTARGYETWYRLWNEAKTDPLQSRTLFIGWWAKDNQRIDQSNPAFKIYGTEPPNKKEMDRINGVKALYGYEVTPEQLAWYRWKTDPGRDLDEDDPEDSNLIQEQPWVEEEAFQQSGSTFFMADKLALAAAQIGRLPKPQSYKFWPGENFVDCEMKPSNSRREVEFRMWEEPVTDSVYVVSADPAFGHDEANNYSAVSVSRCFADGIDQVGEYASATIQPHHFAWLLWTLVGYYGATKPNCRVVMICELNGPGEEVWRQFQSTETIVRTGYLRAAAQEKGIADIFSNCSRYIYGRSDSMGGGNVWQWKTNSQNKVQVMEACRNYLHNGVLTIRSLEMLDEMRSITRDGDKIEAEGRNRDDRTFAQALGVRAWDEKLRRALIAGKRTRDAERAKLSMTIQDQMSLWSRNTLDNFFAVKQARRSQEQLAASRLGWRNGARRAPAQRRW